MVEVSELVGQDRGGGEALAVEENLTDEAGVGHHHGYRPEQSLQVVWKLHSSSITSKYTNKSNGGNTNKCQVSSFLWQYFNS